MHKWKNHLQKPGKPGIGDQSWNARSGETPILIVSYGSQVKKNVDITTVKKSMWISVEHEKSRVLPNSASPMKVAGSNMATSPVASKPVFPIYTNIAQC